MKVQRVCNRSTVREEETLTTADHLQGTVLKVHLQDLVVPSGWLIDGWKLMRSSNRQVSVWSFDSDSQLVTDSMLCLFLSLLGF